MGGGGLELTREVSDEKNGVDAVRIGIFVDNITSAGAFFVDGASLIAVPEPGMAALLGLGILGIYAVRRKFRK